MPDLQNANITWLEDGTPFATDFDDIYFSRAGGPAESEHVFLEANRLAQRWKTHSAGEPFTVVELGFGTGLNFLLCWQLLEQLAPAGLRVHYLAFEKYPLRHADLERILSCWPELAKFSQPLLDRYIDHTAGLHRYCITDRLTLDLYFGDAHSGIDETLGGVPAMVDCWFMDGFAPARNPALWDSQLMRRMSRYSKPLATASTYSVAGQVRRNLQAAGFEIEKLPGFGNKREMLLARRTEVVSGPIGNAVKNRQPWFLVNPVIAAPRTATVIGGGLAGCSTASALATKGWHVTLIEAEPAVARGASGNPQAVLQPRLAANHEARSRFYLHALLFASRQFGQLQQRDDIGWHPCGVLRLASGQRAGLQKLLEEPGKFYDGRAVSLLSRRLAGEMAGLPLSGESLWLPHGGWLQPARLCQAYLDAIPEGQLQLVVGRRVTGLQQQNLGWQVVAEDRMLSESSVVILANGYLASSLPQTRYLPLTPVSGQLSRFSATPASRSLRSVVVAERYICPASNGWHSVGASYHPGVTSPVPDQSIDGENLAGIADVFPQLELSCAGEPRVSVRCNSGDYFPVVGAVPDLADFLRVYGPLARDAGARIDETAACLPGLYVNTAHGSYGLASCPLASEYLASLISREPLPLTTPLADSLSPARFIIRDLKKQRTAEPG